MLNVSVSDNLRTSVATFTESLKHKSHCKVVLPSNPGKDTNISVDYYLSTALTVVETGQQKVSFCIGVYLLRAVLQSKEHL